MKMKIKIGVSLALASGLFCLVKFNIINVENLKIFSPSNVSNQTVTGDQSNAVSIKDSQNTNIKIITQSNIPNLEMGKIMLGERYASEFDNYLGSKHPEDESRVIKQNAILRQRYNPNANVRITPAIINRNEGIPLKQAIIQLVFEEGKNIVVEDHRGWIVQEVNSRYSYKFDEPINNTALNTDYSIFVKFPKPDRYQIIALIDGEYLDGVKEVNYFIEVYE